MKNELTCELPAEIEVGQNSTRQAPARRKRTLIDGAVVGHLVGLEHPGEPIVDFPGNPSDELVVAISALELTSDDVGREVVLIFEEGDPSRPIVLGFVCRGGKGQAISSEMPLKPKRELTVDGERLILTAESDIVLRCGNASITLTRAGKVLIRGAYVLSRSSGANRIKGGSVQIN